jgi:hypothetical protein
MLRVGDDPHSSVQADKAFRIDRAEDGPAR